MSQPGKVQASLGRAIWQGVDLSNDQLSKKTRNFDTSMRCVDGADKRLTGEKWEVVSGQRTEVEEAVVGDQKTLRPSQRLISSAKA